MNAASTMPASAPKPERLLSLDVFRGATIAAMMLVNNPGDWNAVYQPLEHAEWHGWTFTDLVFPFFLWIVGVAIPLSTARRLEAGQSRGELFGHAVRRAAILFGLGLFLNAFSCAIDSSLYQDGQASWLHQFVTNVRIPGVLQRIAVCYLAASGVFLLAQKRQEPGARRQETEREGPDLPAAAAGSAGVTAGVVESSPKVSGGIAIKVNAPAVTPALPVGARPLVAVIVGLLAGYWALMMLAPVPGDQAGMLEKGRNFSQYIDNLVLNGPTIGMHVYKGAKTWDPEGIVSTIPAIATCLFGILTGLLLRSRLSPESRTAWMFTAGSLLLWAGQVMHVWLPINKGLWTSSYTVFMAGMALVCFAVCYWLIDVQGWRKWARPFAIYGMNAITVFVLAGVLGRISLAVTVADAAGKPVALKTFLYGKLFAPFASPATAPCFGFLASPKNASLLWALMYVLMLYLVAYVMYRKKWFVRF
jgi:predicted acyltransferase